MMGQKRIKHRPGDIVNKDDLQAVMKNISASMKRYYVPFFLSLFLLVGSVIVAIVSPDILKKMTDTINAGSINKNIDMNAVMKYGITLISMFALSSISSFISGMVLTTVAMRYTEQLRREIIAKINNIPLKYFDSSSAGDIMSRLTNDVDTLGQSMQQTVATMVQSIFMLVGVLIAMFISSWKLALVCLATLPLVLVAVGFIVKIAGPWFKKRQDLIGDVEGVVEENYNGQVIIKLFNADEVMTEEFEKHNKELGKTLFTSEIFGGLMQPVMNFVSYVAYAAVCLAGGLLMQQAGSGITFGTITAFLVYVNLFQSPLTQIAQAMNNMQSGIASGKRVFAFLGEKELPDEKEKQIQFNKDGKEVVKGEVIFDHVSFGYDENREIIHDFSAHIKPGMKVAIVGPTGAGKTTMVNLLMRFYETNAGNIYIDGVNMKDMKREEIHDIFAMVLQDTWVFEGTLRENLVYNTEGLTEEDLQNAIHDAHLVHFVRGLHGGLDCPITESSEISGGQKQLITIARAMLKKAPLLILDEATSNVDTRTEEKIQEAMDRLSKGKTSFVIAHRLSTIRNSDLILVMKDGNIIEQGTHDELMAMNGFYTSLYNSQFALE